MIGNPGISDRIRSEQVIGFDRNPQAPGVRIEELLEISHHSLIQYRLPSTGEIVPLLQIIPSKTDEERLAGRIPRS